MPPLKIRHDIVVTRDLFSEFQLFPSNVGRRDFVLLSEPWNLLPKESKGCSGTGRPCCFLALNEARDRS
ncbi:hypothetical protein AKJ16_DCAP19269 [Drosera capensis]